MKNKDRKKIPLINPVIPEALLPGTPDLVSLEFLRHV